MSVVYSMFNQGCFTNESGVWHCGAPYLRSSPHDLSGRWQVGAAKTKIVGNAETAPSTPLAVQRLF